MNFKIFIIGIFATFSIGQILSKGDGHIIYYRFPQQNKNGHQMKSAPTLLLSPNLQGLTFLHTKKKSISTSSPSKGSGIIIFYQNGNSPLPQTTNLQHWLPKFLTHTKKMLYFIPKKIPSQTANSKNNETIKKSAFLKKLTTHKPSLNLQIAKPLPSTTSATTKINIYANEGKKFPVIRTIFNSKPRKKNETLESPTNPTQLPVTEKFPQPESQVSTESQVVKLADKNDSDSHMASLQKSDNITNQTLSKQTPSELKHKLLQKYYNENQTSSETPILFTAAHGLNVVSSLRPVYIEDAKVTELPHQSIDDNISDNIPKTSLNTDLLHAIQNINNSKGEIKKPEKSLARTVKNFRDMNYHVTNYTYVADESLAINRRMSSESPRVQAEATEFLPLTFFNPFPLIHSQDESSSERSSGFGEYSHNPNQFFRASEARERDHNPLGSGNFEIVRGGIFRDEEGSENNLGYDRTARGSYNRDYHDYNGPGYDNYGSFPFRLFNALSERRSISIPPRNNRLRFGGTQLIPTTADLLAMD